MAEQQRLLPNAPFPAPPPFWKHFTSGNLSRLKAIDSAKADSQAFERDLPLELQCLRPPTPPSDAYTAFGEEFTLSAPLRALGDVQLFPSTSESGGPINHAYYLTKITKSILLNFLELTTILSADPSVALPKLKDIETLFLNAHNLINMYRPHQARETLIMMMEKQIEDGRQELEQSEIVKEKVQKTLRAFTSPNGGDEPHAEINDTKTATQETTDPRQLWQAIHDLDND